MQQLSESVQAPAVMSPEFIRRAVRRPAPSDPEEATRETCGLMAEYIRDSARDPLLAAAAETAVLQYHAGGPVWAMRGVNPFNGDPSQRAQALAEACWWYAKHQMRFVHHQRQIVAWLGESNHLQLLISPDVLLRFPFRMQGDCAIYSMLIPAMLSTLGVPWELVTVAWDPQQPDIFLHVYPRAVLPNGRRLALDASHGKYPGWSIPLDRRFRTAVWGEDGREIPDAGEQVFSGLHAYGFRRGFGDDGTTGNTSLDLGSVFQPIDTTAPTDIATQQQTAADLAALQLSGIQGGVDTSTGLTTGTIPASGTTPAQSGYVAPSQSSPAWANFAAVMSKEGMTLAQLSMIQPGTLVAPNGTILRQAAGYPVSTQGLNLGTQLTAGLSSVSPMVLGFGALIVVGLLFMGKK